MENRFRKYLRQGIGRMLLIRLGTKKERKKYPRELMGFIKIGARETRKRLWEVGRSQFGKIN